MKTLTLGIVCSIASITFACDEPITLVLHGGAGEWNISHEKKMKIEKKLEEILKESFLLLKSNHSRIEVVEKTIVAMEDSGLLNAGKGAVRNKNGDVELDSSIMDGKTLKAGAVAAVKTIKNPILAAKKIMEKTPHVLMVGGEADKFLKSEGITIVDPSYFKAEYGQTFYGTVGSIALDCNGNLAAGTSTGGLSQKLPGRVGDSPIIGAGNYANNLTCAVSATGQGEYFIRQSVAHEVSSRIELLQSPILDAAESAIKKVGILGGKGGLIALSRKGEIAAVFNSKSMLRGYIRTENNPLIEWN